MKFLFQGIQSYSLNRQKHRQTDMTETLPTRYAGGNYLNAFTDSVSKLLQPFQSKIQNLKHCVQYQHGRFHIEPSTMLQMPLPHLPFYFSRFVKFDMLSVFDPCSFQRSCLWCSVEVPILHLVVLALRELWCALRFPEYECPSRFPWVGEAENRVLRELWCALRFPEYECPSRFHSVGKVKHLQRKRRFWCWLFSIPDNDWSIWKDVLDLKMYGSACLYVGFLRVTVHFCTVWLLNGWCHGFWELSFCYLITSEVGYALPSAAPRTEFWHNLVKTLPYWNYCCGW